MKHISNAKKSSGMKVKDMNLIVKESVSDASLLGDGSINEVTSTSKIRSVR